jgi:hypothetical protein
MTAADQGASHVNSPARAWDSAAHRLADWVLRQLVNRSDVWGAHNAFARRGQAYTKDDGATVKHGKSYTAPRYKKDRGTILLTRDALIRHFRATGPEHVLGLHSTGPDNLSRWGGVDLDWHGPTSTAPAVNLAVALACYERLRHLGFLPLLEDSNGTGGYHLWLLFNAPVLTAHVFAFMRWLVRDHARYGMTKAPETFPKQAQIGAGRYGNWLRVPGRHHSSDHYSRVWDGAAWLEGASAVDHLLSLRGDAPALIPAEVVPPRARPVPAALPPLTRPPRASTLARRIAGRLAKLPSGLGEGQHRDDYGFKFAAFLVRDLALSDADALPWLRMWDARNAVPKGEDRLVELVANARAYGKNPIGCGLSEAYVPRRPSPAKHPLRRICVEM